MVLTYCFI